jgi:hypothetical protein
VPAVSLDANSSLNCPEYAKWKKDSQGKKGENPSKSHPRNYSWSELMKRVFGFDVLQCDRCGGRMRILCAINPPDAIKKILDCHGLPSRPTPISAAVLERPYDY